MREIGRLVLVLVLICAISAGALSWVRSSLAARIDRQSDLHIRGPALARLFGRPAEELLTNKISVEMRSEAYPVFYVLDAGEVTGLALEAPGHGGYAGDIVIMIAVDRQRREIQGVEIVSHGETPGVGSQVEKDEFRIQWRGLSAVAAASLRKDGGAVDAITGATFSSRAMIDGTNQVTELVREHETEILALIAEARGRDGAEAEQ